jgi:DNA-binding MarR family transcriptional regulator
MGDAKDKDRVDALVADWRRERPDLDAMPMGVVGRILRLGKVLEARANTALADTGLSYSDLDVLATLRRSGTPYQLSPTSLRDSVLITSGAMTACLDRLEGKGLVSRSANRSDRRSITAGLTEDGYNLIEQAIGLRFGEAQEAVSALDPTDRDHLANLLRKMTVALDNP